MERAQCCTIRTKLLRIGARVRVTVRRVWISLSSGYAFKDLFAEIYRKLKRLKPLPV